MAIQFRRGAEADLPDPTDVLVGEPLFTVDTGKLYVKRDDGSLTEITGGASSIDLSALTAGDVVKVNSAKDGFVKATAPTDYISQAQLDALATVASTGVYTDLTGLPTIPSTINDILPDPSQPNVTATVAWSVANQQWEVSQDTSIAGFEFRGFVYPTGVAPAGGFVLSSVTVVSSFVNDADSVFPFTAPTYNPKIEVTFTHNEVANQWMYFAYRWDGGGAAPSWTPAFYKNQFLATANSQGSHTLDLGDGSKTYLVYQLGSFAIPTGYSDSYFVE
jgi:hypothetical protein